MSWKSEVQTAGNGDAWSGNALRFGTEQEAKDYVYDLMMRWTSVTHTRAIEVDEPVNYIWENGRAISIKEPESGHEG